MKKLIKRIEYIVHQLDENGDSLDTNAHPTEQEARNDSDYCLERTDRCPGGTRIEKVTRWWAPDGTITREEAEEMS